MEPVTTKNLRLIGVVRESFHAGVSVDGALLRFLTSMGWEPSVDCFTSLLTESDNCDAESLLTLLFYPDMSLQCRVESLLEKETFTDQDEKEIIEVLRKEGLKAMVHLPDASAPPDDRRTGGCRGRPHKPAPHHQTNVAPPGATH